jgi:TPR repeat protein
MMLRPRACIGDKHRHYPEGAMMTREVKSLAVAAMLIVSWPAWADDQTLPPELQAAIAAYHDEDYPAALEPITRFANEGIAQAQAYLGRMYDRGDGVEANSATAVIWYRKAADQGDAQGQRGLGDAYYWGSGVTADPAKAMTWYRKAAEQGDSLAQVCLGDMLAEGDGVPENDVEALKWYVKAANAGHGLGQLRAAEMYEKGMGTEKNLVEARHWYGKAAEQDYPNAVESLKRLAE